jgi:hypothetical protein
MEGHHLFKPLAALPISASAERSVTFPHWLSDEDGVHDFDSSTIDRKRGIYERMNCPNLRKFITAPNLESIPEMIEINADS